MQTVEEKKEKLKKYQQEYYKKNKETILKKCKKYRDDNKDKIRKYHKKHYIENKEEIDKKHKEYRETHKAEISTYHHENHKKNKLIINAKKKAYRRSFAKYDVWFERMKPYYPGAIQQDPENKEFVQVRCKYCNNWFNPTNSQIKGRWERITGINDHGVHELYCSKACKRACPSFNQKKYPKGFKQNTSREVQPELRKMVFERDNWTCQKCGKSKKDFPELILHCHHIFPINEDPIRSADMDNCETLCKECHLWKHKNIPGCGHAEMRCSEEKK